RRSMCRGPAPPTSSSIGTAAPCVLARARALWSAVQALVSPNTAESINRYLTLPNATSCTERRPPCGTSLRPVAFPNLEARKTLSPRIARRLFLLGTGPITLDELTQPRDSPMQQQPDVNQTAPPQAGENSDTIGQGSEEVTTPYVIFVHGTWSSHDTWSPMQ